MTDVRALQIPADAPSADGTLEWDKTATLVRNELASLVAGGLSAKFGVSG